MAVYVDEILDWTLIAQARGLRYTHWCHLTADTEEELHAFAKRLGLRRSWYQRKGPNDVAWHYDIVPSKRALAVRLGAREVDYGFIARLMDQRRRERDSVPGGMVCGNDPNAKLTDGDRKVLEDFGAFLEKRAAEGRRPGGARRDTVAYRSRLSGGELRCLEHGPAHPDRNPDWMSLTSDDLGDGGICSACGRDVLIPQT